MNGDKEILALKKYEKELNYILGRFKKASDGIHINKCNCSPPRAVWLGEWWGCVKAHAREM